MDNKRFLITNDCTKCSHCLESCPEKAIHSGEKYTIDENCTGCGQCEAVCPDGAIIPESDPYLLINREMDTFFGGGAWPVEGKNSGHERKD